MKETIYIPIALFIIAAYLWYRCIKQRNSGTVYQDQGTGKNVSVPGKVPFTKIGSFWFAVICTVSAIGSLLIILGDR